MCGEIKKEKRKEKKTRLDGVHKARLGGDLNLHTCVHKASINLVHCTTVSQLVGTL